MFKKFISMATAMALLATGLGVVGATSASAAANVDLSDMRIFVGMAPLTISPSFSRSTTDYTASTTATNVDIVSTRFDEFTAASLIKCNAVTLSFAAPCQLILGSNTLTTRVSNGGDNKTYTITITRTASGGSSPAPSTPTLTAAEIAAAQVVAAQAAAEAAAAVRAAEVAVAQTKLSTVLKADKAGTIDEYKSANVNITTAASLARINAEVLKLSANDRADFAKIKALADKIEFDESFFNATARPSMATYSSYGVTGVTDRILPTINAKVLELPAALRADVKAMQELVKVESFVDRVANTVTRGSVSAQTLIQRGLFPAESPYKHSVVQGLASYPEGSLNTMAKIEAAIKAELVKAGARKAQTAEIRARIAARNK